MCVRVETDVWKACVMGMQLAACVRCWVACCGAATVTTFVIDCTDSRCAFDVEVRSYHARGFFWD